ncbi:hypothetical protein MMC28_007740 [Mycoblastus sanguinarius]|nr:hypothetical protein [Mycoblastus sanguinarius]
MGGSRRHQHRSASVAAVTPAAVIVNNEMSGWEQHSPVRSSHNRHSSHGHDYNYEDYDDDSWDEQERSHSPHHRRRGHSRPHESRAHESRAHESKAHESRAHESRSHDGRSHESRSPSPYFDLEYEKKMKKLEEIEKREEEEEARARFEQELIIKEAKKAQKKKEEDEFKKKAIEEYNEKQAAEKIKKEKEKKEADAAFKERVKATFSAAGYSDESIEKILKKGEKGKGEHKDGGGKQIIDLRRPTYIKVHRKHLSPETLDEYDLPWSWDERDSNFIIIKKWIPEHEQDILFEHTRRQREKKLLTDATVDIKRQRDNLLLVRRKSPGRKRSRSRGYIFT